MNTVVNNLAWGGITGPLMPALLSFVKVNVGRVLLILILIVLSVELWGLGGDWFTSNSASL